MNLKRSDKYVALSKLSINDKSYSVSDIQGYFEYMIKKHERSSDNAPIKLCVNKTENRITFKIKTRYCLEL